MGKQVRQALQAWADHVWQSTGQGVGASNVLVMPKRACLCGAKQSWHPSPR